MDSKQLADLVSRHLQPLLDEYQFSVHEYSPYGDVVEYRSEKYRLKFYSERSSRIGETIVGVGIGINRDKALSYDLMLIAGFISHRRPKWTSSSSVEGQVKKLSKLLLQHADLTFRQDLLTNQAEELKAYTEKWAGTPSWSLKDWRAGHGYQGWRRWFRRWFKERG